MKPVLEGILFLVGDDGITINELIDILKIEEEDIINLLDVINEELKKEEHGIIIKKFGQIYKLTTKEKYKEYYKNLANITNLRKLSQSALETLAIIAYNEPISRVKVDEFRGINSQQMIRNLIAKDLIKEVGKSTDVGKPYLYGITDKFLDYFGLDSKDDLPKLNIVENSKDVSLYESKYKDEIEEL